MNQDVTTMKPLFLSEEEAMAILDLCLASDVEMDDVKERALRKVTDLARAYLRDVSPEQQGCPAARLQDPADATVDAGLAVEATVARLFSQTARTLRSATLMTMSYGKTKRAHDSLWRLGAMDAGHRNRLRETA